MMTGKKYLMLLSPIVVTGIVFFFLLKNLWSADTRSWTDEDISVLKSLWIGSLPTNPKDPSNAYADNPKAVALGRKFFFDTRFSGNLKVSCDTCHPVNMNFADNLPLAHGMGTKTRRTMPLIGAAYHSWLFWDGRKDSLWSQALGPIESPVEHGFTRTQCAVVIDKYYKKEYEEVFGKLFLFMEKDLPKPAKPSPEELDALKAWVLLSADKKEAVNRIYVNMGKAIAAFVRTIRSGKSRFDIYAEAVLRGDNDTKNKTFTEYEVRGLKLFIGKAKCINCHNGPLFSYGDFHSIRAPKPPSLPPDTGRAEGITKVLSDEFNCVGKYSDATLQDCSELRFMSTNIRRYRGAFKTPTLRNVAERAP